MNSSPPPANSANGDTTNNGENGQDLNLNFLDKIRLSAKRDAKEDEGEELPTELNTINSAGGFLVVSPDKLSVKYTNTNLHGHDVGVVQANKPAPIKCLTYYFEIFVKDSGIKGQIAIGFTKESFKMRRQPGYCFLYLWILDPIFVDHCVLKLFREESEFEGFSSRSIVLACSLIIVVFKVWFILEIEVCGMVLRSKLWFSYYRDLASWIRLCVFFLVSSVV